MHPLSNLHTHTTFSDGIHTAEEYVKAAIEKGFVSIGFSEHAYTCYDGACCIKQEEIPQYYQTVGALKDRYRDQIEVYLGFEADFHQMPDKQALDYLIGSVHYIYDPRDGAYESIDYLPSKYEKAIDACGGIENMLRTYYGHVVEMAKKHHPDIIGHLDLASKLNKNNCYFNPDSSWYRKMMLWVADELAKTNCIVEANTGGISRGHQNVPNPGMDFFSTLYKQGVAATISSDAHQIPHLDYAFEETGAMLKEVGYRSVKRLQSGQFVDVEL